MSTLFSLGLFGRFLNASPLSYDAALEMLNKSVVVLVPVHAGIKEYKLLLHVLTRVFVSGSYAVLAQINSNKSDFCLTDSA